MSSDFESVAEQLSTINEDGMSRVSKLAHLQLTLEERVKALEEDLSFAWLLENGFGDLIKNQVATNFVRGQETQANEFAEELADRGMPVNSRKWVEPMSLKAWYKESTENGISIPDELFGGYIGEKAKITTPKKG